MVGMREALEEAYDASEENAEESVGTTTEAEYEPTVEATEPVEPTGGEEAEEPGGTGESKPAAEPAEAAAEDPAAEPEPEVAASGSAPASWTPTAKEAWSKLPPEVQEEVTRRERDISRVLSHTAEARKGYETFRQITGPFEHLMRMEGASPFQAVDNLVKTAAHLRLGTQVQKSQIIQNIINQYGVDIPTLDSVLSGQPAQDPVQSQIQQQLQRQMAPVQKFMQNFQQREQQHIQEVNTQASQSVAEFGKDRDFFNDVKLDMADLLDMAANRSRPMTLEDAYAQACQLNPEIKKIMDQRTAAALASTQARNLSTKKAAASSVTGQPSGNSAGSSDTLRGAIQAAMGD